METKSEVARILAQIEQEHEACRSGLQGLAQGISRHSFITARMEQMSKLHQELMELVGTSAMGLIVMRLDKTAQPSERDAGGPL